MTFLPTEVYAWTGLTLRALRAALAEYGFLEILPAILSQQYEPGARHSVAVLGRRARPEVHHLHGVQDEVETTSVTGAWAYYLPVSHAVEKQLAVEHVPRVYCLAPCVRLLMEGEEESGRHLYTFFQVEIEWRTMLIEEVFETAEAMLALFARQLLGELDTVQLGDRAAIERIERFTRQPYPRIRFQDALALIRSSKGPSGTNEQLPNPHSMVDLTHAEEQRLGELQEDPYWLYDYPEGVRDSLYHRNERGTYDTYDLMLPGTYGELASGGVRPQSGQEIRRQSTALGEDVHAAYATWKDRTGVQSAGFGIGLERLIRYCAGADNILALRSYHDNGPNASIGLRSV